MTQEQIIAANRVSALEQVEQDERNDELKAQIEAEKLLTPAPRLPRYEHEQTFKESTLEQLSDIQRENVESSRQN